MSYPRLAERLYSSALLITPDKADAIERVFRAHLEGRAGELPKFETAAPPQLLAVAGQTFTRQRSGYLRSDSGIALIQIVGSLMQRSAGLDAMSGIESYANIAEQLKAAVADPQVRGILLEIDSPGGEGNGVAGLAELISAAAAEKPVIAQANEIAFSAAYWLAAAAGELYVPATGMVGSIGVIMLHVDQSRANEKKGLEVTHITAGARKADFSPHQPLSESALGNAQAMVDRLYGQFVGAVADARGVSADTVRGTEAGLLNPDQALELGLVNGIATLDQSMQRLADLMRDPSKRKSYGRAAVSAQSTMETLDMSTPDKPAAATAQPAAFTQAQLDAARAEGLAQGKKEATTEAQATATAATQASAADAAKARIKAIMTCDAAAKRQKLAAHIAYDTDLAPDAAATMLAASAEEAVTTPTNALAAAMPKNPAVGVGVDAASGDGKPKIESSDELYARRRAAIRPVR